MRKILYIFILSFCFSFAASADDHYDDYEDYSTPQYNDALEPVNRAIYEFNNVVDGVLLDPLARAYNQAVPKWVRKRVSNFAYNVSEPVTVVNSVLQGDAENAFTSFWRFAINSTFGLLGTFDAASEVGLKPRQETFGQTLYSWGLKDNTYLMLPIIGPSTLGNTVGIAADFYANPLNYEQVLRDREITTQIVARIVDAKTSTVAITDNIKQTALDPYTSLRSMYIQNFIKNAENR